MNSIIEDKYNTTIERFYDKEDDCYHKFCSDTDEHESFIDIELAEAFESLKAKYSIDIERAFENAGYECSVLSVAWIENDNVVLKTLLLEEY